MTLNFDAWKQTGNHILYAHVTDFETREQAQKMLRSGMDAFHLEGTKRRFIADYCMSQLGFGGGF